jgi:hypothetical protein
MEKPQTYTPSLRYQLSPSPNPLARSRGGEEGTGQGGFPLARE